MVRLELSLLIRLAVPPEAVIVIAGMPSSTIMSLTQLSQRDKILNILK
jgi:hypothetical protein